MKKPSLELIGLFLLILFSLLPRTIYPGTVPPGLYGDEAQNLVDAWRTWQAKDFKLFYPSNFGREGLYIWILGVIFGIFGPSVEVARIVTGILGTLTVLGFYLFVKEWTKKTSLAFFSSFFLSFSFWHLNFSRVLFRAILAPLFLSWFLYLTKRAQNRKENWSLILGGVFLGLGFYSYISYRFLALFSPLYLWLLFGKKEIKKILLSLASTFLAGLPIGVYFLLNPEHFFSRASGVSVFNSSRPLLAFLESLASHVQMFFWKGDFNWRHNLAGSSQVLFPLSLFLVLGFFYSLKKVQEGKKEEISIIALFLLTILPSVLTIEGIPHSLRAFLVILPVFYWVGLGFERFYSWIKQKLTDPLLCHIAVGIFLGAIASGVFYQYFGVWANREEVRRAFEYQKREIGKIVAREGKEGKRVVVASKNNNPVKEWGWWIYPVEFMPVIFSEIENYKEVRAEYLGLEQAQRENLEKGTVIIPLQQEPGFLIDTKIKIPFTKSKYENNIYYFEISY